jgi:hypothetical protein
MITPEAEAAWKARLPRYKPTGVLPEDLFDEDTVQFPAITIIFHSSATRGANRGIPKTNGAPIGARGCA